MYSTLGRSSFLGCDLGREERRVASFVTVVPLVVATGVLAVAMWLFVSQIRGMAADPDYKAAQALSWSERRRMGKLIRSEQVISDPDDWKNGETNARLMMKTLNRLSSGRYVVAVLLAVVVGPLLLPDLRSNWLIREIPIILLFAIGFLWGRRTRAQIERTAALNGWNLKPELDSV